MPFIGAYLEVIGPIFISLNWNSSILDFEIPVLIIAEKQFGEKSL